MLAHRLHCDYAGGLTGSDSLPLAQFVAPCRRRRAGAARAGKGECARHSRNLAVVEVVEVVEGILLGYPVFGATTAAIRPSVERYPDEKPRAQVGVRGRRSASARAVTETMLRLVPAFTVAWALGQRLMALGGS